MNSHEVFIHIHQRCFAGTGAIVRLPQCQWRKPDGYWEISQCITTTKHSKAKTVCTFLGIYCIYHWKVVIPWGWLHTGGLVSVFHNSLDPGRFYRLRVYTKIQIRIFKIQIGLLWMLVIKNPLIRKWVLEWSWFVANKNPLLIVTTYCNWTTLNVSRNGFYNWVLPE